MLFKADSSAASSAFNTLDAVAHPVVTDLTVCIFPTDLPPRVDLGNRNWYRVEKDLHLYTSSRQSAWLYLQLTTEKELEPGDLVVTEVRVGAVPAVDARSTYIWESRPGGIRLLRSKFSGKIDEVVTGVDVLFGADAVEPRPQWTLGDSALEVGALPKVPAARLTVLHGRAKPIPNAGCILRARKDGTFKILQISDMHMVTGVGVCRDAVDAEGNFLPETEADTLTVEFAEKVLDAEEPDLVILTGDQLHHDIEDTQTALFKAVAPIIKRSIPFVAVFGNHDTEGTHALSRAAQMSILQSLPFSLCQTGPHEVDGIGNCYLQILAPTPSQLPVSTLYFLDSHGQIPNDNFSPDYSPINQSQIDWFLRTSRALRSARGSKGMHLSLAFQHIPLPEYKDPDLMICSGQRREPTESPRSNSHFYSALSEEEILAIGCGHDHVNNFCALIPHQALQNHEKHLGPWLCYGGGSGFGGYCSYGEERFHRQMRVWNLETDLGHLTTWMRVEYASKRADVLVLAKAGTVTLPHGPAGE